MFTMFMLQAVLWTLWLNFFPDTYLGADPEKAYNIFKEANPIANPFAICLRGTCSSLHLLWPISSPKSFPSCG